MQLVAGVDLDLGNAIFQVNNVGFNATLEDSSITLDFLHGGHKSGWDFQNLEFLTPVVGYNTVDSFTFSAYIGPQLSLDFSIPRKPRRVSELFAVASADMVNHSHQLQRSFGFRYP